MYVRLADKARKDLRKFMIENQLTETKFAKLAGLSKPTVVRALCKDIIWSKDAFKICKTVYKEWGEDVAANKFKEIEPADC